MTLELREPAGSSPSIPWFVSAVQIGVAATALLVTSILSSQMVGVCHEVTFFIEIQQQ